MLKQWIVFGEYFVIHAGIMGASILYLCINTFLIIVYACVLAFGIQKK